MKAAVARREFLRVAGQSLGIAWAGLSWSQVLAAADHAHVAARSSKEPSFQFLSPEEAADVEAIAAQIIPTDDTPGAREAGVVYFVDRALATFYSRLATTFRAQLREVRGFAALRSEEQVELLTRIERTAFFDTIHMLTVLGMFTIPAYGGNRAAVGWTLLGFEDVHTFQPPFGYYDRDYPGFIVDPDPPA
jgi:gluconate 2-dehydrogenase gamma chain